MTDTVKPQKDGTKNMGLKHGAQYIMTDTVKPQKDGTKNIGLKHGVQYIMTDRVKPQKGWDKEHWTETWSTVYYD